MKVNISKSKKNTSIKALVGGTICVAVGVTVVAVTGETGFWDGLILGNLTGLYIAIVAITVTLFRKAKNSKERDKEVSH